MATTMEHLVLEVMTTDQAGRSWSGHAAIELDAHAAEGWEVVCSMRVEGDRVHLLLRRPTRERSAPVFAQFVERD